MNRKKSNAFLAAWLALLATTANAQSTASTPASATEPPKEMEAIVLSPFTVDASKDHGYIANRDVTGSRLNTALRDVPAAMTIFTQEMLRDLGVINAQQALEYAPNTEFTENTVGFNNLSLIKMRIRGFANAGAGPTQDFFQVFDDLDTYKIDRIGFSRGPNGVLFGGRTWRAGEGMRVFSLDSGVGSPHISQVPAFVIMPVKSRIVDYTIDGDAFVWTDRESGATRSVLGYPMRMVGRMS